MFYLTQFFRDSVSRNDGWPNTLPDTCERSLSALLSIKTGIASAAARRTRGTCLFLNCSDPEIEQRETIWSKSTKKKDSKFNELNKGTKVKTMLLLKVQKWRRDVVKSKTTRDRQLSQDIFFFLSLVCHKWIFFFFKLLSRIKKPTMFFKFCALFYSRIENSVTAFCCKSRTWLAIRNFARRETLMSSSRYKQFVLRHFFWRFLLRPTRGRRFVTRHAQAFVIVSSHYPRREINIGCRHYILLLQRDCCTRSEVADIARRDATRCCCCCISSRDANNLEISLTARQINLFVIFGKIIIECNPSSFSWSASTNANSIIEKNANNCSFFFDKFPLSGNIACTNFFGFRATLSPLREAGTTLTHA